LSGVVLGAAEPEAIWEILVFAGFVLGKPLVAEKFLELQKAVGNDNII